MTTAFDINDIKESAVDVLKSHLCPEEMTPSIQFDINSILQYEIAQSFKPYSTVYRDTRRTFDVQMIIGKEGDPSGTFTLSLMTDNSGSPYRELLTDIVSGTVIPAGGISTINFSFDLSEMTGRKLDTNSTYWLKLTNDSSIDVLNHFKVYQSAVDTGYLMGTGKYRVVGSSQWDSLNADYNFRVSVPTWVYPDYPFDNLGEHSYPRMAVDIIGRGNADERWLCVNKAKYYLTLGVTIYSKYPEELDDLASYVDRILWFERLNIRNIINLHPAAISQITQPRAQLFVKTVTCIAEYIQHNEEIS